MKVHEYQAKSIFASYGLPVDRNIVCRTPDEAVAAYKQLGLAKAVVKAQVHTGGRGKAGGVKLGSSEEEIRQHAEAILGMDIKGFTVDRVLVSEAVNIASEYYMSILVDRKSKCPMLMLSRAGGMDIEQVAKETPEKIEKIVIDPTIGMSDFLAREAAFKLFDDMAQVKQAVPIFKNLYKLFVEKDASLAEINPLVMTQEGTLKAIDAKMTFDDNALFWRYQARAVRSDNLYTMNFSIMLCSYSVERWYTFCNTDDKLNAAINSFQHSILSERCRNKDNRSVCLCCSHRIFHRVENRDTTDFLSCLTRRGTTHNIGSILFHL